jgi:hypothetical protein
LKTKIPEGDLAQHGQRFEALIRAETALAAIAAVEIVIS